MNAVSELSLSVRPRGRCAPAASFDKTPRPRTLVLAGIIGLHVVLVIAITMVRAPVITPPDVPKVLMTQLIAEPTIPKPAPPVAKPVPRPVIKSVPTPRPKPKPVVKPRVETPPVADSTPGVPTAAAESSPPVAAAPALPEPSAPPAPPAPPAQTLAITPPRFNAAYLNNPPPVYPVMARRLGEEGKVMLRVYVTPEGTAGEVRVQSSSGSPMFDEAAIEAVRQWRFVPARQGDNPVAAWVQVPIVFRLT